MQTFSQTSNRRRRMIHLRLIAIVCSAFIATLSPCRADDASGPALKRGVSLSNWFSDSARQSLSANDFQTIAKAEFDFVRIPVNPEFWGFSLLDAASGRVLFDFSKVDQAIALARDNGLAVVFDIYAGDGFMGQLEQDPKGELGFIALWRRLAEHYKDYPTDRIAFEILSEPAYAADPAKYMVMISGVVSAIRAVAPKNIVIVDAPGGAAIDGLEGLTPIPDDNIYYGFHYYEPYVVTHQGLRTSPVHGRSLRYVRRLPYPASSMKPGADYAPNAADSIEAKKEISDYASAGWDAEHIAARIGRAADWAAANHTHVICTEFGIVRNFADPAVRYQWIADTRKALEAVKIGWAVWDYADAFGITQLVGDTTVDARDRSIRLADPVNGSRNIEPDAIQALFGG